MSDQKKQISARTLGILETVGRSWAVRPELLTLLRDMHGAAIQAGGVEAPEAASRSLNSGRVGSGPNGVAVIPLQGLITPQGSLIEQIFGIGGGGLEGFRAQLRDAVADPDVGHIVLNVDSPGGLVDQVPETADLIRQARSVKPVVAVANTLMASAAYWLGSQAHEVVISPSGEAGSIGVYQMHQDWSKAMEMDGVTPTIISAGKYKVEGNPYEPLDSEAQAALQQGVDDFYNLFTAAVAQGRGVSQTDVQEGYGEGRVLTAKRARSAGLVDRVATLDDTVNRLASGRARVQRQENAAGTVSEVLVWDDPAWGRMAAEETPPPEPKPTRPLTSEEKDRLLDALAVQR